MLPLPSLVRQFNAYWRWYTDGDEITGEYAVIGGASHMRATSQAQANAVAQKLRASGLDAKGYFGFACAFPSVAEFLGQVSKDPCPSVIINRRLSFTGGQLRDAV